VAELRSGVLPVLVLWDVDHTLIENSGVSKENYEKAFATLTGRAPQYPVQTDGRTDPEIIRNMLSAHGIAPADPYLSRVAEALEAAMSDNFSRLRDRGYELPGARAALAALQELPGVVQSVLTGNIRPNAFAKLSAFGLDPYIDFDAGGYGSDDKVRSNLVAVARERAQAKYGLMFDRATTLLVGDTTRDVRAGRDGGAHVLAVASGGDTVEQLRAEGADVVLPDLRDTSRVVAVVRSLQAGRSQGAPLN
jgi:phosphoglycolate phosphatase-like HAD superfamily hydrolase